MEILDPRIDAKAYRLVENFESLDGFNKEKQRYFPYRVTVDPPGLMTIGKGHALHGNPSKLNIGGVLVDHKKDGLTKEQVDQLYRQDCAPRVHRLLERIPKALPHEYGALLCLLFNNEFALVGGTVDDLHNGGAPKVVVAAKMLEYHKTRKGTDKKTKKPIFQNVLGLWRRRGTEALYYLTGEILIADNEAKEKVVFEKLKALGVEFTRPIFPPKPTKKK